jgi:hypothetical protein
LGNDISDDVRRGHDLQLLTFRQTGRFQFGKREFSTFLTLAACASNHKKGSEQDERPGR